jgi:NADP-dependent 3-hydroxy acid dehydrogenase YdfG
MADPVLLITGASSGIGMATARLAAASGYRVALAARRTDLIEAEAAALGGPERAIAIACDVSDWEQVQAMVAATLDAFGRIDGLFANAGAYAEPGWKTDPVEVWRTAALVNVYGTAITTRAALDAIIATKGKIILTSSRAGRFLVPGAFYACTKAAVTAMGEALRLELNDTGAHVCVIEPGWVNTPMAASLPGLPDTILEGEDIARAVMFVMQTPDNADVNQILIRATTQPV